MLNKTLLVVVAFCFSLNLQAQNWDDLNNQVLTYLGNGEYVNALSAALRAREVAKKQFGENNADYSASLHNLASAHKKLGEFTPAEILYWEATFKKKFVLRKGDIRKITVYFTILFYQIFTKFLIKQCR